MKRTMKQHISTSNKVGIRHQAYRRMIVENQKIVHTRKYPPISYAVFSIKPDLCKNIPIFGGFSINCLNSFYTENTQTKIIYVERHTTLIHTELAHCLHFYVSIADYFGLSSITSG